MNTLNDCFGETVILPFEDKSIVELKDGRQASKLRCKLSCGHDYEFLTTGIYHQVVKCPICHNN